MDNMDAFLSICGVISIIGSAGAIIVKVIAPAFRLSETVEDLKNHNDNDFKRINSLDRNYRILIKSVVSIIDHIDDKDTLKEIRGTLLDTLIMDSKNNKSSIYTDKH